MGCSFVVKLTMANLIMMAIETITYQAGRQTGMIFPPYSPKH